MTEKEKKNNTLAVARSDLAAEWHPTKNGDLTPNDITVGSNKKVWWQCASGHSWEATVCSRTINGNRCPICSGQKVLAGANDLATIYPEIAKDWHPTKNGDLKPNMVTSGSSKEVWWLCSCGTEQKTTVAHRVRRGGCIKCRNQTANHKANITPSKSLSCTYPDIAKEWHPTKNGDLTPDAIMPSSRKSVWWICKNGHEYRLPVIKRIREEGCPICRGCEIMPRGVSFAVAHPDIAKEWHPTKNGTLTPGMVSATANKRVWWICSHGHEWESTVLIRSKGHGCPVCSGRNVLVGYNDLASLFPEVAKEWHPTKNGTLTPENVSAFSHRKVWWQCENNHEWLATINNRTDKESCCPHCKNSKGEKHVIKVLEDNNIHYETQYHISNCRDKKALPFDIGILGEQLIALIEYDGAQHRKPVWGEKNLGITQKHDKMKDDYCKMHNIPLLRIPDDEFDNIDNLVKEFLIEIKLLPKEEPAA